MFFTLDPAAGITVFILENITQIPQGKCYVFHNTPAVRYQPYCDDFGPFNMSSTICFIKQLQDEIAACMEKACHQLVYAVHDTPRSLSNAVMLLGSYLILITRHRHRALCRDQFGGDGRLPRRHAPARRFWSHSHGLLVWAVSWQAVWLDRPPFR